MGGECCNGFILNNGMEEIYNCTQLYELRKLLEIKIKDVEQEQNEIKLYINKGKIPDSVEVTGFQKDQINKRIPYLDEIINCLKSANELLQIHTVSNLNEIKKRIMELYQMYTWIYDDEYRCKSWLISFKYYVENDGGLNPNDYISTTKNKNIFH